MATHGTAKTATRRVLAAPLLAGILAGPACNVECRGPACESAYPEGRVDVLGDLPLDGREVLIDDVALGSVQGSVVSGSAFSVAATPDGLVVGQPEARTVRHLAIPEDNVPDDAADNLWASFDDGFGSDIAVMPTADGSGWSLVVAAPYADRDRGVIRVYHDADAGSVQVARTLRGATQGDRFGQQMRLCPDRSGDGLPELLVTAPWMQPDAALTEDLPALAGVVLLVDSEDLRVGETRPVLEVATAWWGDQVGDSLGVGLDCANDLDGDGLFDIVLGAPLANSSTGSVYVLASTDGFVSGPVGERARLQLDGDSIETFGSSIATFVRPEGPQLLVGAPGFEAGRGAASWIDAGDFATTGTLQPRIRFESDRTTPDHFGRTVAVAELDGDDLPDLLIGGPDRRAGALYDVGQLAVFLGNRSLSVLTASGDADLSITDDQGFRRVGRRVVVHDVDGDGIDELLLPTRSPRSR
jgi:hypothetical protein